MSGVGVTANLGTGSITLSNESAISTNDQNVAIETGTVLKFGSLANNSTTDPASSTKDATVSATTVSESTTINLTNVSGSLTLGSTISDGTNSSTIQSITNQGDGSYQITIDTARSWNNTSLTIGATTGTLGQAFNGSYGTIVLNSDGSYTYTLTSNALAAGQSYTEKFNYTMRDTAGETSSAIIHIALSSPDNLTVSADTVTTNEDTTATGNVLTNDTVTTGTKTVSGFSWGGQTANAGNTISLTGIGSLLINSDGSYTFTPTANYNGAVPVALYTATDGTESASATLTMEINAVNDAPTSTNDSITIAEDTTQLLAITDFGVYDDIDGDSLSAVKITTLPSAGSLQYFDGDDWIPVTLNQEITAADISGNKLRFTPASNASGSPYTTIGFEVSDGTVFSSGDYTLTVNVTSVADAPVNTVPGAQTVNDYETLALNTLSVDDADDDITNVKLSVGNGTLATTVNGSGTISGTGTVASPLTLSGTKAEINAMLAGVVYTPNSGFSGSDSLRMLTTDDTDLTDLDFVAITVNADSRALTVTGTTVNEASPYLSFQVSGVQGQRVSLELAATGSGSGHATIGQDVLPTLEYYDGSWKTYTSDSLTTIPSGGILLVRVAVQQDSTYEGTETLKLIARNTNDDAYEGTGTIKDDGTGDIFLASNTTGTADNSGSGYPGYKDDDRTISVNDLVVNEASPYAIFTVSGFSGQIIKMNLVDGTAKVGTTATDGTEDYKANIEVYNGSAWVSYTANSDYTLTSSTLLVRTALINDTAFEGQESYFLGVTRVSQSDTIYGTANIYDNGSGSYYPGTVTGSTPDTTTPTLDDDRTISIDSPTVNEASDTAVFTISGNSGQTVLLEYIAGTADALGTPAIKVWDGLDWVTYDANKALPTFDANGKIFVSVDITGEQDTTLEGSETLQLKATLAEQTFNNGVATNTATDGKTATGTATIKDDGTGVIYPGTFTNGTLNTNTSVADLDNDSPVTITNDDSITEGETYATYTVTAPAGKTLDLALGNTADAGDKDATIAGFSIQYSTDNSTWTTYTWNGTTGDRPTVPGSDGTGTLYVRVNISSESDTDVEGAETFTLSATAATGKSDSVTSTITDDDSANTPPTSTNDSVTTDEDTAKVLSISDFGDYADADNNPVSAVQITTLESAGALQYKDGENWVDVTINQVITKSDIDAGKLRFMPAANENGANYATVGFKVSDGTDYSASAYTLTINVTAINDAGTFGGHTSGSGDEDGGAITGTLSFSDAADGATTPNYTVSTAATNGAATINVTTGAWSYTPNADYNGNDSFVVTVTDDDGHTETQTISLTVAAVADIVADTVSTNEDTAVSFNPVTGTNGASADSFEGSPVITAINGTAIAENGSVAVTNGSVSLGAGNVLTFTPANGFTGSVPAFTYTVTSGGVTETANINVTVNAVADTPATITGDTSGSGAEDGGAITGDLNATDVDGLTDGSYFSVTGAASKGIATINASSGAWSYTPNADYNGTDSFTVTVTDDKGGTTTQVVNLTVTAVADIANDTQSVDEDSSVTSNLLTNDSFEGTESITGVTQGTNGTVSIVDASAGTVKYTPNANFNGSDSYTYTVTSGGVTETATVNVTVAKVNDAGTFGGDKTGSGDEDDGAITGTLSFTDTADGATTPNFTVSTAATNGTATINATTGAWSYTPNADYNGNDSFVVTVTDDDGHTETQTISLTVAAVADIANDTQSVDEDSSVTSNLLTNDSFEGTESITGVTQGTNGTVSIVDASAGTVKYTPNANFNGSDSYTYTVTSGGVTETATVNVTVAKVNDAGTFGGNTSGSGDEDDGAITGTLSFTDTADGATTPNFTVSTNPGKGTATINATTGAWSYTPNGDYNGNDSFVVTVTDDDGHTETQTISLTVAAVADIANDTQSVDEDSSVTSNLLTNDSFEGTPSITAVTNGSNGSVEIVDAATGTVKYTPNANFNGTDSYTYTVTSGGVTETATVNVTVAKVNDAGTFGGDKTGSGDEDTNITGTLTFTDTADGATTPNFTVSTNPGKGTATINATTGAWSYTPNADYNGNDSFVVTVTDDDGHTETQTISLTVTAVADIANDTQSVDEDSSVTSNLLTNDSFEGTESITGVTQGTNGSVSIVDASTGTVKYTPNANFNGTDSYTYTVTSGGVTETATVNVTVAKVNDAGTFGGATSGTGDEDGGAITGTLSFTDTADGATTPNFTVTTAAGNGTATINATTGAWSYTPSADYNGSDSFVVTVTDDDGHTETQTISLTVTAVADIVNDTQTVDEDSSVTSNLLTNDSFEGTESITGVTQGTNGSVSIVDASTGTVKYTPNANFNGTDSYTYTVTSGGVTETATVNVTVTAVNDAGTFGGDISGNGAEDTTLTGTLTFSDAADGATSPNYTVAGIPSNGSVTIDSGTGAWSYTPTADFHGSDSFVVTVTDDDGHTETQTISLTVNAVADIVNDTQTVDEDSSVTSNLLTNDSFEGTPSITAVTQGANGTVNIGSGGNVTYTPNANFNGTDSYTYTVTSGGVTEIATVNVTVNGVDDATIIGGDTSGVGNEDTSITGTLTAVDPDGLTDGSYFTVTGAPGNGTASINAGSGAWSYTPNADYNGNDSFTVTVTDDLGGTTAQVINITVAASTDIADDTQTVDEDNSVTTNLLANDSFEGTPSITAVTQGSNGTVTIVDASTGTVTYTPNANFSGSDSYTYTVTSGGVTETATVNVTVNEVGNSPGTFGGDISGSGAEDTTLTGTLTFSDTVNGATTPNFTVSTNTTNGNASINATTGAWSYTPNADYNGNDSFVVTVTDDDGHTETQTISLAVTAVADIVNDTQIVDEDRSVTSNLLANDNFEGTPSITAVTQGTNGEVTIVDASAGTVAYTPNANFNGTDSYTYTVTSGGVTEAATVNVTVNPVNEAGLTLSDTSLTTGEDGTSAEFTLTLDSPPRADVTFTITGLDGGEGNLSTTTLTFTPDNWNTAQTVTVTGLNDDVVDGNQDYTLTLAASSTDADYNNKTATVAVTNLDNDTAGLTLSDTTLTTGEDGTSANFTLTLDSQPTADVTFTITGLDSTEGSLSTTTVTFTAANWNTPQTVTVTGVDDALVDGDQNYTLTLTAASTDANYNGESATVSVTNLDNDTAGLTLSDTTLTTGEDGTSANFSLTLDSQPTADVTFTITGLDGSEGSLSTTTLTFTPANWNTAQTVTVTGVDDALVDGDQNYTLTLTAASTDTNYNGETATVAVTNLDNGVVPPAPAPVLDPAVTPPPPPPPAPPAVTPPAATPPVVVVTPNTPATPIAAAPSTVTDSTVISSTAGDGVNQANSWEIAFTDSNVGGDHQLSVERDIPMQSVGAGQRLTLTIPTDTFSHTDQAANLTLAAVMNDGTPLPAWLSFDTATGEISGTPPPDFQGEVQIRVVARDPVGRQAETIVSIQAAGASTAESAQQNQAPTPSAGAVDQNQPPPPSAASAEPTGTPGTADISTTARGFVVSVDSARASNGEQNFTVDRGIPDLGISNGTRQFNYQVPVDAFVHTDPDAEVELSALMPDGSELPGWLVFDAETGQFSGEIPEDFEGELLIQVIARDQDGRQAEAQLRIVRDGSALDAQVMLEGRLELDGQLTEYGVLAWKAEQEALVRQALEAAEQWARAQAS